MRSTRTKARNAGATYQRLVNAAFQYQIGRNLEAYVDDMVIKSNDEKVLIADIAETFDNLWRINMKLNPKKCSFKVEEGKFLVYMVTFEGIRANPKKTKAIADMQSPRTLKEMQILSGKLAALKRFLSRRVAIANHPSKGRNAIRIRGSGNGGHECRIANRKKRETMSDTLHEQDVERSREELYPIGKIGPVIVTHVQEVTKVLADFLSEASVGIPIGEFFRLPAKLPNKDDVERWTLFTDGTSNNKGSRAGLVLVSPSGVEFTYALRLNFTSTNNEEKYEALLAGLCMARKMKGMDILGPLPQAAEKLKFVIVAIDYFTKWIKVKPLARITRKDVKKFVWGNIVLTYESEAMIPAEIGMPTHRTMMIREDKNEDELRLNMDFLQERREAVVIREAKYKTKMEQYYNQKARPMLFKQDEYVF
ncbi:reverse transcriptase domain-containing protein [Tanacetum coccineum]